MSRKITIYTISEDLGLSPGTISKIINNKGNFPQETIDKVLDHIEKVGYVPSTSARILKSKRTYTIGVIFSEELKIGLEHSFFSGILQHFKNYAEIQGYELSFIVQKLGKNTMSYYEWCLNKKVDGVYIVVGDYNDKELIRLATSDIPCVSTDMILPNLHTVISDNSQGIKSSLEFVQNNLKLNKIAYIAGPQNSKAYKERLDTLLEVHKDYKLELLDLQIAPGFGFTSGYNSALKIIENNKGSEVVLVGSDDISLGVLKAFSDNGIRVPEDIQVIGFDDIEFAKHFTPPLTTIRQDKKVLGETAAKTLIELIETDKKTGFEIVRIPVELISRESTIEVK